MMKRAYRAAMVTIIVILSAGDLAGQYNQTQYFMNLPQAGMANPAYRPSSRVYIGLPALSGIYFGISNNMASFSELFQPVPGGDSLMTILHPRFDRESFLNSLGRYSFVSAEADVQLMGVGFSAGDNLYFDISLSQRATASLWLPTDLFTFLLEGNESFTGSVIDLSGIGVRGMQYLESSVGVSANVTPRLRIGGRAKLLFGGLGASLHANRFDVEVHNDFSHTITTDLALRMSGPFTVYTDEDGMIDDILMDDRVDPMDILANTGNSGVAFDLGAIYDLTDEISLSASITDLGFIGWDRRSFTLTANNNFSFDGFDVTGVIEGDIDFDEMVDLYADSLSNSFDLSEGDAGFGMGIPGKIYLGAGYSPAEFINLGLLSRTLITQGHMSQSISLSANLRASDVLGASIVYTMANRSFTNLGMGLSLRMGPVQFYTIADQIPLTWNRVTFPEETRAVPVPDRIDYFNLRLGMNLLFGRVKPQKRDVPMLLSEY
jgi:hypothetical protein